MAKSTYYQERISKFEKGLHILKRESLQLVWIRLISFLCFTGLVAVYLLSIHHPMLLVLSAIALLIFAIAVNRNIKLEDRIALLGHKIQINKDELKYLEFVYANKESGSAFVNLKQHLAIDFDLFGSGSLFQYINRCITMPGKLKLAQSLCNPPIEPHEINNRQDAIRELCQLIDYVQDFQSYGKIHPENGHEIKTIQKWIDTPNEPIKKLHSIALIVASINLLWIILVASGVMTWSSLTLPIFLSLGLTSLKAKKILKAHAELDRLSKTFVKYKTLFRLMEAQSFTSPHLCSIQKKFLNKTGSASQALDALFKILSVFEIRDNILLGFLLNAIFLINIQIFYHLQKWKTRHQESVKEWFDGLAEMELLLSLATYAFNNSETTTFPQLQTGSFYIEANEVGHPLIANNKRVNNSFEMSGSPSTIIITGANMAGKSTFLRTIVVNLLLGMNGAPVCAKEFTFTPCNIVSSIKIQDSLSNNESYFYAELVRIKEIIEETKQQPLTLIVLDEILRGTNTKDKQTGSIGLLEKLIKMKASVIIATHDLIIGELENKYPHIVKNHCFEVELAGDLLQFDYRLKKGISKKLNASLLMRRMGIID